jgi:hypothetical protein
MLKPKVGESPGKEDGTGGGSGGQQRVPSRPWDRKDRKGTERAGMWLKW